MKSSPKLPLRPPAPSSGHLPDRPPSRPSYGEIETPPPPSSPEHDLAQVEAAMSLLDGRHPDFIRAEREKAEAMDRRRREVEQLAIRTRTRNIRRAVIGGALAVTLAVGAYVGREQYEGRKRAIAAADAIAKSFAPFGFQEVTPTFWQNPDKLEVQLTAGTCAIALGASNGKPTAIELLHDGDTLEAQGSIGFCTCASETAVVTIKGGEPGKRSVRLLRTDAREFGSVSGFTHAATRPTLILDCACAEDQIDGWLGSARAAEVMHPPDVEWSKKNSNGVELVTSGLAHVNTTARGASLIPLAIGAGSCTLAVASDATDSLSLRAPGGARLVDAQALPVAVCSKTARTLGVWHEGKGAVHVLRGDAARLGGRHQLRRVLGRSGYSGGRVWTEAGELAWDAELTLRAVRAAPTNTMTWGSKVKLPDDARFFLFSLEGGAAAEAPAASAGDAACERGDEKSPTVFCVQTSKQAWKDAELKGRATVAYAPLPVWLKPLADIPGREANAAGVALASLAHDLVGAGFEPTPLEGVTETRTGADVLGRAGEDAIVAVTVQNSPPYLLPLTDGPTWTLEGTPRVIALAPGRRLSLKSRPAPSGIEDDRRTIVFRHAAAQPTASK